MTPENFCYWMQSCFEIAELTSFNKAQTKLIKQHLAMVFEHTIDPALGTPEHVEKLRQLHEGLEGVKKELANKSPAEHTHPQPFDISRRITC